MAAALAVLGDKTETINQLSQVAEGTGCFAEVFEINEEKVVMKPWFSTAAGNYVYALNQALVQCRDDQILIAPAVPDAWKDFSFKLPCFGNLMAAVSVKEGRLRELTLIPGQPDKPLKRTVVIPARLVDQQAINKGAAVSMSTHDGCVRLDVQFTGKTPLLQASK
jgi:hypothetical protein